jgi:hypothetical protein
VFLYSNFLLIYGGHACLQGDEIYDATLNQTNVGDNNNKFYIIQALGLSCKLLPCSLFSYFFANVFLQFI